MRLKSKLDSVRSEIVLILTQDRCTVCAERNTALEIILDAPDGTLGVEAQVEARFSPFKDSANLVAR
jgi:sulfur transfer complex TusBCD TusB component (DsrH family)